MIVHATLVAAWREGRWRGVLLRGPSGAGKSDLALRAISCGWRLVADDRVRLWRSGGAVYGAPPPTLAGLLEARGLGVLAAAALPSAAIRLVADACERPERVPEAARAELLGLPLPACALAFLEGSAPAKLERALEAVLRGRL